MRHFSPPLFGSFHSLKGAKKNSYSSRGLSQLWVFLTVLHIKALQYVCLYHRVTLQCFSPAFLSLASNSSFFKAYSSILPPCCSSLPTFTSLMHFPHPPINPLSYTCTCRRKSFLPSLQTYPQKRGQSLCRCANTFH